ncbi:hypothetical protein DFQ30_006861 [Apophysomyces sp. BC1015]|nr:hypothetical protein DFQ30_006861 [Apophysomyces sp. BC1015]
MELSVDYCLNCCKGLKVLNLKVENICLTKNSMMSYQHGLESLTIEGDHVANEVFPYLSQHCPILSRVGCQYTRESNLPCEIYLPVPSLRSLFANYDGNVLYKVTKLEKAEKSLEWNEIHYASRNQEKVADQTRWYNQLYTEDSVGFLELENWEIDQISGELSENGYGRGTEGLEQSKQLYQLHVIPRLKWIIDIVSYRKCTIILLSFPHAYFLVKIISFNLIAINTDSSVIFSSVTALMYVVKIFKGAKPVVYFHVEIEPIYHQQLHKCTGKNIIIKPFVVLIASAALTASDKTPYAGDALANAEPVVTQQWTHSWWYRMLDYLQLSQEDLGKNPLGYDQAVALLSTDTRDIRIEVLIDLIAVAMQLDKQDETGKSSDVLYDARARRFLSELTRLLKLDAADLGAVERSIGQQIYFALKESTGPSANDAGGRAAVMDQSAQKTIDATNKKKKAFRWLATGAGIIGGGAVIVLFGHVALTGGLAAPLLAPLIVGWKMHRRTKGIEEFGFQQILDDADVPPIPTLQCTICISGFLLESKDETRTPWERAFSASRNYNDIYCLEYETETLLQLGYAFRRFITNQAMTYAGKEVAMHTALQAFFAAVALPAMLLKVADVIDNQWVIATDRSRKAGAVLADVLEQRVQELARRNCQGIVDHVVLMGAPISGQNLESWREVLSTVSGRFINCYTDKDWVLAFVHRLHSMDTDVAGLKAVDVPRVENVELQLDGHTDYPEAVADVLTRIGLDK